MTTDLMVLNAELLMVSLSIGLIVLFGLLFGAFALGRLTLAREFAKYGHIYAEDELQRENTRLQTCVAILREQHRAQADEIRDITEQRRQIVAQVRAAQMHQGQLSQILTFADTEAVTA